MSGRGLSGDQLPELISPVPGPRSRALAVRLGAVESPNITCITPQPPIFWEAASGANVRDVDGNLFLDLTAGFGVAAAGHAVEQVVSAIAHQAAILPHALGDVYPADAKVRLLERLAAIMPEPLRVSVLASSGSEAVEVALKTAVMHTRRTGILAFRNSYHGLTYGALAVTHRSHFRTPFDRQLYGGVRFAGFPDETDDAGPALNEVDAMIDEAERGPAPIGAILIEPIQGRGGIAVPPPAFLAELRRRCDGRTRVLIFDEVYTGCGRTGRWLACEHWNVVPDLVAVGKALSGSLPISACIGSAEVMAAWPASRGEAIHTSTFLGNPVGCAAALAQLGVLESENLLERAMQLGNLINAWAGEQKLRVRGRGLIQGLVLASGRRALDVCAQCLREGILVLAEGADSSVLAITPPATITEEQLRFALARISAILARVSP